MSSGSFAAAAAGRAADAAHARAVARQILSGPRFHSPGLPRPLHGVFQTLGGWLKPVGHALARAYDWVAPQVGGHPLPGAVGLAAVAVTLVLAVLTVARRFKRRAASVRVEGAAHSVGPAALREAAARAERDGDLSKALRLYYSAAILELQAAGRLPPVFSLTAGQARRALHSPRFDRMALAFEGAAYGGRGVDGADLELARTGSFSDAAP